MTTAPSVARATGRTLLGVITDVPVTPDAPTARSWARDELAHPRYSTGESVFDQLLGWLRGLFDGVGSSPSIGVPGLVVLGTVIVTVIVVAIALAGRFRRTARTRTSSTVLGDDVRSAQELRRAADTAAAGADWTLAVLERFRAVVRALEERTVLDERPGRTAHEVGVETPERLEIDAATLEPACSLFDAVCYGDRAAGPQDDDALRRLDDLLADARRRPARRPMPAEPAA